MSAHRDYPGGRRRSADELAGRQLVLCWSARHLSAMPVLYDFRGEVLELRAVGDYAPAEVATAFRDALADPARPKLRALLYDVRESQEIGTRSTPDVREAVAFFSALHNEVGQRAALLASTDLAYGVMRMVAGWAEGSGIDVEVFRDAEEAYAWASR